MSRTSFFPVSTMVGIALLSWVLSAPLRHSAQASPEILVYSAKIVCGSSTAPAAAFVPGEYRTTVNIHNPQVEPVIFDKKAVIAESQDSERGLISEKVTEQLLPDEALRIDCQDALSLFEEPPSPRFLLDGFVVIEAPTEVDVTAVYTSAFQDQKQEILFRTVTEPFKVQAIVDNGASAPRQQPLPDPGPPPGPEFMPEVVQVDFEKIFVTANKVIYEVATGTRDVGTREVLLLAPALGEVFPNPWEKRRNTIERIIRNEIDRGFDQIVDVDATLFQTNKLKQEVTYRWVTKPTKVVVGFTQNQLISPHEIAEDEDLDGMVNEDPINGVDDDGDGEVDEDPSLPPGQKIEILDTDIALGSGISEDIEQVQPKRIFVR